MHIAMFFCDNEMEHVFKEKDLGPRKFKQSWDLSDVVFPS